MDNPNTSGLRDPDIDENQIAKALLDEETGALELLIGDMHPADFSDQFEELTDQQRGDLIDRAPELITGDVLTELEDEVVEDILPLISSDQLADTLTELDNDEVTQIIEEMAAPPFWTVGDTINHMRSTSEDLPDVFYNVYIIDTAFKPIGYVPVSQIMRQNNDVCARD